MATGGYVIKNATVKINNVDMSEFIKQVTVHKEYADVDATGMRSDGAMEHLPGLRNDSFALVAKTSFAAAALHATIEALFEAGDEFPVEVVPTDNAVSVTNPSFTGNCILLTYEPVAGAIGALATTPLTLPCNGRIAAAYT